MQISENYARHCQSPESQSSVIDYIPFLVGPLLTQATCQYFGFLQTFLIRKEKIIRARHFFLNSVHLFIKKCIQRNNFVYKRFQAFFLQFLTSFQVTPFPHSSQSLHSLQSIHLPPSFLLVFFLHTS